MRFKEIRDNLKKHIRLYSALYKDKNTPLISRIFLWIALGYFFIPFDLIPDFIPFLGQLDDALIVPGFIFLSLRFIPHAVYRKHYKVIFDEK